ncbi:CAZyme family AA3 [Penicillium waksmanii]|uniref:CAZyme family AA3 n=1 Tax=Penicillium waksmanii TaxID=69791 RepID=UPI0025493DD0|nr:CAZyme family AA3 [Penicillium waksmanii]KAJ5976621.1 CAZyme family AA3 [Penicillium waksmanii]
MTNLLPTASCTTKNTRFFFVNGNEPESRKHAMREHWRKRKERKAAAKEHDKPFGLLRSIPQKDRMVCRMEAHRHSDDPILSQDHPYSREATSTPTHGYPSNMQPNPCEDTLAAAVVQSPCNASQPLEGIVQGSVDSKPRIHGVCNLRVTDASFDPVVPHGAIEDPVSIRDTKGMNYFQPKDTGLYGVNDVSCVVASKL